MGNKVLHVYAFSKHPVFSTNQKEANENPLRGISFTVLMHEVVFCKGEPVSEYPDTETQRET